MSAAEVFLCHSSKDKPFVRRLADDLEILGLTVWLDEWQLSPGDSLVEKIGQGIGTANLFCVLLSQNSIESRWCKAELNEALTRSIESGEANVVAIKKGRVEMPPFLRGKVYINSARYSFSTALRVAWKAYGLPQRSLEVLLRDVKSGVSKEIALSAINHASIEQAVKFGKDEWGDLKNVLERRGIEISDHIKIFDMKTAKITQAC